MLGRPRYLLWLVVVLALCVPASAQPPAQRRQAPAPAPAPAPEAEDEELEDWDDEDLDEDEGDLDPADEDELDEVPEPPATDPYAPQEDPDAGITTPRTVCHGKRIRDIRVEGARRVSEQDVEATLRLREGVPCTDAEITRDARALWDLGFFDDLVFEANADGSSVDIVIRVTERPAIGRIVLDGNDEVDDDDIEEKLTLEEGGILSIPDVQKQVTKIKDLYAEEGFFLARVTYEVKRIANDKNEVEVLFHIDEGQEVTVRRVAFVGNRNLPSDELHSIMQTSETGFFSFIASNDTFNKDAFEEDVTRLQAWYYDKGYLSMAVGTPRIELTPDRSYIDITIPITEGPRFRIGRMKVEELDADGREIEPLIGRDELEGKVVSESGDWFSRSEIAVSLQDITRAYRDEGYARVEVLPQTDLDSTRRIVDVTITIQRGPLVRIERIHVRGNSKTRDRVIRREIRINEGDLYNQTQIERSKTFIQALGYFEQVNISEEQGTAEDLMVLNFEVGERPTGTFQVGAGFSSIEQFILTAQIQQQNLFGNGQSLQLQLQLSGIRQLVQVRFAEPWFLGTQWSLALDAFKTIRQFQSFVRDSTGGGVTFGHPIFDPRFRVYAGYQAELVDISARTGGLFGSGSSGAAGFNIFQTTPLRNLFQDGLTSSIRLSLGWDSRDNRMFTSNGVYANYTVELADRFLGSDNVFVRQTAFTRFYKNIWGPLVWKLNVEAGLITSRLNKGVPVFERFYLGGIYNVRGYPLNSLGPRVGIPNTLDPSAPISDRGIAIGGNLQFFYQMELEFPIIESVGIRGVLFTDGGNAWNLEDSLCQAPLTENGDRTTTACEADPFALRTSVGFGFRWFSPLGPLRFEWGIPLAPRDFEKKLRFEFTIGNSF